MAFVSRRLHVDIGAIFDLQGRWTAWVFFNASTPAEPLARTPRKRATPDVHTHAIDAMHSITLLTDWFHQESAQLFFLLLHQRRLCCKLHVRAPSRARRRASVVAPLHVCARGPLALHSQAFPRHHPSMKSSAAACSRGTHQRWPGDAAVLVTSQGSSYV